MSLATFVRDLFPGYFALVMATGIVSIAAQLLQMPQVAWALLGVNVISYVVLVAAAGGEDSSGIFRASSTTSPATPGALASSPWSPGPACSAASC